MASPRFLADEMVGRLARYLRFVGCDTLYARGWADERLIEVARREDRIILTRDRGLAARAPRSLLLTDVGIEAQWKAVTSNFPDVPRTPQFVRCSLCNGRLVAYRWAAGDPRPEGVPWERVEAGLALYRCEECGHLYWPGSHTAQLAATLQRWSEASS